NRWPSLLLRPRPSRHLPLFQLPCSCPKPWLTRRPSRLQEPSRRQRLYPIRRPLGRRLPSRLRRPSTLPHPSLIPPPSPLPHPSRPRHCLLRSSPCSAARSSEHEFVPCQGPPRP